MGTRRKPNTAAAQPVTDLFNIMETINSKDIEIRGKSELIENLKRKNDLKSETIERLKQSLTKVNLENQEFKKHLYKRSGCGQFLELPKTDPAVKNNSLNTRIGNRAFTIIFIILFFGAMFILNIAIYLNTDLIIKFMLK